MDLHEFFVMGMEGGGDSLNGSEDNSILYLRQRKLLYNVHILKFNLLYLGKSKNPLCKCNNMQVIPSKGKEKVSCVWKVSLLQLSSLTLWGKAFGERPKHRYSQSIQFLVQHNVLISFYRAALLCTKHAINVWYIRTCK